MIIRECPKCGKPDTSGYGFCIYCGAEFPEQNTPANNNINKFNINNNFRQSQNLNNNNNNNNNNIEYNNPNYNMDVKPRSAGIITVILVGYFFSIFGSILGLIPAIYLITCKDMSLKKHGVIQLAIITFYILLVIMLFASGALTMDKVMNIGQAEINNISQITKL